MQERARTESERLVQDTRARLEREAEQTRRETLAGIRAQAAELVVLAAEKVLREKLDEGADRKLVEEALKNVSQSKSMTHARTYVTALLEAWKSVPAPKRAGVISRFFEILAAENAVTLAA